ncbi:MAG: E3 binding domain-containing protein, partial [Eudoraea sp.]|nr:E3 binding domain-containing protein [Eudoraea sp.]
MSKFELKLPQMGESVAEATLTSWLKEVGDTIEMDEAVFEIATDKVDSEVPSEVDGVLVEKRFDVDDVIKVGETVAVIQLDGEATVEEAPASVETREPEAVPEAAATIEQQVKEVQETVAAPEADYNQSERFYSPLVKNIASKEGISPEELDAITGTGLEGRVTKNDILDYLASRKGQAPVQPVEVPASVPVPEP